MTLNEEELQYLKQMEMEVENARTQTHSLNRGMATMFSKEQDANLVKWQLDIAEELERIEHLLRKHVPTTDEHGNEIFVEPNEEDRLFNETGIQEILNILAWYLNKNIILSNYDDEEVAMRVKQFASILTDFIFINYERFGLDTKEKIKHFPMVVLNVVNTVEAAYHRALFGGERTSLRTARTVHQTENPAGYGMPQLNFPSQKKFSIMKPSTWR